MKHFYFRPNQTDFPKWCSEYVPRALWRVRTFEEYDDFTTLAWDREEYHEALRIKRQYEVLCAALTEPQRILLEKMIHRQRYNFREPTNSANTDEIYALWKAICFPKEKPLIQTIDTEFLGKILREQRMRCGMSAALVSELLQIAPATLYAYETGMRPVKLNVLYGMSQLYDVSIDELIRRHFL